MSHTSRSSLPESASTDLYAHERSNVARLTVAQALAGANSVVVYATGAIVGNNLAPNPALATLPISVFVVGMAVCTLPAGAIAQRYGRRAAFLLGTACGVLVGLLAALAIVLGSFWLFSLATFFGGAYAAVVLSFRFAAADCVPPDRLVGRQLCAAPEQPLLVRTGPEEYIELALARRVRLENSLHLALEDEREGFACDFDCTLFAALTLADGKGSPVKESSVIIAGLGHAPIVARARVYS